MESVTKKTTYMRSHSMTLFVNLKDVVEFAVTIIAVIAIAIFVLVMAPSNTQDSKKGDQEDDV